MPPHNADANSLNGDARGDIPVRVIAVGDRGSRTGPRPGGLRGQLPGRVVRVSRDLIRSAVSGGRCGGGEQFPSPP